MLRDFGDKNCGIPGENAMSLTQGSVFLRRFWAKHTETPIFPGFLRPKTAQHQRRASEGRSVGRVSPTGAHPNQMRDAGPSFARRTDRGRADRAGGPADGPSLARWAGMRRADRADQAGRTLARSGWYEAGGIGRADRRTDPRSRTSGWYEAGGSGGPADGPSLARSGWYEAGGSGGPADGPSLARRAGMRRADGPSLARPAGMARVPSIRRALRTCIPPPPFKVCRVTPPPQANADGAIRGASTAPPAVRAVRKHRAATAAPRRAG